MSPQQTLELAARAKAFIDRAIEINREYGMGVVDDVYEEAVEGSARIAVPLAARIA